MQKVKIKFLSQSFSVVFHKILFEEGQKKKESKFDWRVPLKIKITFLQLTYDL